MIPKNFSLDSLVKLSPNGYSTYLAWATLPLLFGTGILFGCTPDNKPMLEENQKLQKQVAKQDSLITSLQEGNRVMQKQIDLLNQELRQANNKFEQELQTAREIGDGLVANKKKLAARISDLEKAKHKLTSASHEMEKVNHKLTSDAQWLRKQREQFRKGLHAKSKSGNTKILPHSLLTVTKATTQALAQHGYVIMARMGTDQKVVYVTEQKRSLPPSLELQGFRNQYLAILEKLGQEQTKLSVRADFEKVAGEGRVLRAGLEEITEIELRLIQKIEQALTHLEKA